jgi:hypothetical protein
VQESQRNISKGYNYDDPLILYYHHMLCDGINSSDFCRAKTDDNTSMAIQSREIQRQAYRGIIIE